MNALRDLVTRILVFVLMCFAVYITKDVFGVDFDLGIRLAIGLFLAAEAVAIHVTNEMRREE